MGRFAWQDERTDWRGLWRFPYLIIGCFLSVPAVSFGLIIFMEVVSAIIRRDAYSLDPGVMAVSSASTAFFGLVAFRLISGEGAKAGGGLFSPMGYRLLGVVLAVLALIAFFGIVFERTPGTMIATVLFATPSVLCFVAAQHRAKEISQ